MNGSANLFWPAVLAGASSVFYWHFTGDLRFYIWIQLMPLVMIPAAVFVFLPKYSHRWLLLTALGLYAFAKVTEFFDIRIFDLSHGIISGHTLKHVLSAFGCLAILLMLEKRAMLETKLDDTICDPPILINSL